MRATRAWLLAALCACGGGETHLADPTIPTNVGAGKYHLTLEDGGATIVLRRDTEALLTFAPDAFQLGIADVQSDTASWDPWDIEQRGESDVGVAFRPPVSFTLGATTIDLDYGDGVSAKLEITEHGGAGFRFDLEANGDRVVLFRVRARTSGDPHEGFYGTGEQEDSVDRRGTLSPMQLEPDLTLESGYIEAHVPVPFVIGTHGWSIFVASKRTGVIDVAKKDPSVVEFTFSSPDNLAVYVAGADEPLDLVSAYFHASGPQRLPSPWAVGPWIWRDDTTNQAQAESDIRILRTLDLATSGIWLDHPFSTHVNTFDFDPARYTDPKKLVDQAHAAGLRVALWSTPYLERAAEPLLDQAKAQGFFPPVSGFPLNPFGTPIDFTNEAAASFWIGQLKHYSAVGVDGFKLDYGEDVVPSIIGGRNKWRFFDNSDERTMHHTYSSLYHRVYQEALGDDAWLLCRAAHWGEQASGCVIWPGDMDATFTKNREHFTTRDGKDIAGVGGLPATIVQGLSLAASGFPFFGADTGGYRDGPPSAELFTRWAEQTALSTVMQVGGATQPPWTYDVATVDIYRTFARLHMRLFPYEWTYAVRGADDGRPIQRPFGLAHPELGVHPSDQYFFGDDLLVAPILLAGQTSRDVVLPEGTWFDWWDATPYTGDSANVPAPIKRIPILVRDGAIVPMLRPTIDTLAPADDPDVESYARDPGVLWARIAPGRPRRFVLYDGATIERVASGTFALTAGSEYKSGFVLEMIGTPAPFEVSRDDTPLPQLKTIDATTPGEGWSWTPDARGTLSVKVAATASRIVVR
jgi:alpha-D-xyloside xylohydrolase